MRGWVKGECEPHRVRTRIFIVLTDDIFGTKDDHEPAHEKLQSEETFANALVACSQKHGHIEITPCVSEQQQTLEGVACRQAIEAHHLVHKLLCIFHVVQVGMKEVWRAEQRASMNFLRQHHTVI